MSLSATTRKAVGATTKISVVGLASDSDPVAVEDAEAGSDRSGPHTSEPAPDAVIRLERIHKIYHMGRSRCMLCMALRLIVHRGEFVAIMGPSGSGKSTMMNIIGCLDRPTKGHYFLDGMTFRQSTKPSLADIRNQSVGFVFQSFNLVPRTSALENVELPLIYAGVGSAERSQSTGSAGDCRSWRIAERNMPNQFSGGQQQRVAIARSLVNNPSIDFGR